MKLDKMDNRINALRQTVKDQQTRIEELNNRIEELNGRLDNRYPSPIVQCSEDIALYEAIFDILAGKSIATQAEIQHYLDQYKQIWVAIVNLLIDKGLTTPKELNCEMLAYHHFYRLQGYNSGKSPEELFKQRQKYVAELMALPDPLSMIGR